MLPYSIFLISVTLVSHVSAALAYHSTRQLLTRQSTLDPSDIPAVCSSRCAGLVSTVNACATSTDLACGCSLRDEQSGVDCLNCINYSGGVTPSAGIIQSGQAFVDEYVQACNLAGVPLPATTLSGAISEITSTFTGNSFTSVDPKTLTSATGVGKIPIQSSPSNSAANPTETKSTIGGGLGGIGGNKNSGSRIRKRETAGVLAAAAVAAVLVVFF